MTLDGTYEKRADGFHVVRFDRFIERPPAKVWAAISDSAMLKNWLGEVDVEPRIGGKFIIHFRELKVVMTGRITAIEPERVIEYSWLENYGMPQSIVRWEIVPAPGGCRLTLAHTFPPESALTDVVGFLGGWHAFLDVIPGAVDGKFMPYQSVEERQLDAQYRATYTGSATPT